MAPFLSSSRTPKAPKSPKSSGRSLFSKALPAPPVFDRLFSSSSSNAVSSSSFSEPALPPLPPPSSNLLDTASYSFVPSAQTPGAPPESSYSSYSGYPGYPGYPGYSGNSGHSAARSPQQLPNATAATTIARRPMPDSYGASASAASPATSVSSATLPLPSLPSTDRPAAKRLPPQPFTELSQFQSQSQSPPAKAIRRRPVGRDISVGSSSSNYSQSATAAASSSTPLPTAASPQGLSAFNFQDVASPESVSAAPPAAPPAAIPPPQLPDVPTSSAPLLNLPELPAFPTLSQDFQLPPRQHSPPPSPPHTKSQPALRQPSSQPARPPSSSSSRAASISSILSAYSQSSQPVGRSSASEDTASTNHSSYLIGSSPPPVLSKTGSLLGRPKEGHESLTPLSYLLEEHYGKGDDSSEVTEEDLYRHYGQYDPQEGGHASFYTSTVSATISPPPAPPPPSKDEQQQQQQTLPPRSTSLRNAALAPKTTSSSDDRILTSLPSLPAKQLPRAPAAEDSKPTPSFVAPVAAPASQLWKRRSEKVDGTPSLPELDLTLASTPIPATSGSTFANSNARQQRQLSSNPKGSSSSTLPNQPALPPPLSPLPPPPSRSNTDQLHVPPPRSPFAGASPRIGLPGRDIRPNRQASPAVARSPAPVSASVPASVPVPVQPPLSPEASTEAAESIAGTAINSPNSSTPTSVTSSVSKMGQSFSKFEARMESKLKRKGVKNGITTNNDTAIPLPPAKDISSSPSPLLPVALEKPSLPPALPLQRLPTPDYDDEEERKKHSDFNGAAKATNGNAVHATATPAVFAPASPATSPAASPASTLGLGILPPPAPFAQIDSGQISPKTSPHSPVQPPFRTALPGRDIRPAKNASPVALPEQQQPQQQFSPRTSSRKVSFSTPQYRSPDDDLTVSESGSQLTIKATPAPALAPMQQLSSPPSDYAKPQDFSVPPAMPPVFPTGYMAPAAPDAVHAAPPPGPVHYGCLHQHREMFRDRNVNYPLSCQSCQTFERSVRWRCKWCYLRVCTGCRTALQSEAIGGDLERLMAQLSKKGSDAVHKKASASASEEAYGSIGQGAPLMAELPVIREA